MKKLFRKIEIKKKFVTENEDKKYTSEENRIKYVLMN